MGSSCALLIPGLAVVSAGRPRLCRTVDRSADRNPASRQPPSTSTLASTEPCHSRQPPSTSTLASTVVMQVEEGRSRLRSNSPMHMECTGVEGGKLKFTCPCSTYCVWSERGLNQGGPRRCSATLCPIHPGFECCRTVDTAAEGNPATAITAPLQAMHSIPDLLQHRLLGISLCSVLLWCGRPHVLCKTAVPHIAEFDLTTLRS